MPELKTSGPWLNGDPLTTDDLKGKVVLVNFWTYSCISCVRAIPYLNDLNNRYHDQGLVIVSVHTPEYAFEKVTQNVTNAIAQYQINYPVVQDNSYSLWNNFNNQFWPANYVVDREGKIVFMRLGDEGQELVEQAVHQLIGLPGGLAVSENATQELVKKPSSTINFGLKHIENFSSTELPSKDEQVYTFPEVLRRNAYALEGVWKLLDNKADLTSGYGRIRLNFNAANVSLTAQSIKPVTIKVSVDGHIQPDQTIQDLKDYQIFSSDEAGKHVVEIAIPQPGFEASQFIFE